MECVLSLKKQSKIIIRIRHKQKKFTDEDLFLEIKTVWDEIGRRPSYDEFKQKSRIGIRIYEIRFLTWRKSIESFCAKWSYNIQGSPGTTVSKELLLSELKIIASKELSIILHFKKYKEFGGTYSIGTFQNHFGSWKNAVEEIGKVDGHKSPSLNEIFFLELQRVWEKLGRQPKAREIKLYSKLTYPSYRKKFGSWMKAIHAFCKDRESNIPINILEKSKDKIFEVTLKSGDELSKQLNFKNLISEEEPDIVILTTSRAPSLRLRFKVLK